jgi:hypothetical protein
VLSAVKEQAEAADKLIASWADTKPWINENDTKAAADKVASFGDSRGQAEVVAAAAFL